MGALLEVATTMYVTTCTCGGTFAISEEYRARCQEAGNSKQWYCPYCQTRWSYGQSKVDKLAKQLESTEQKLRNAEWLREQAEAQASKAHNARARAEGELRRTKTRIHNGVCPCCNRTFTRLGTHMTRMHPEYSQ